MSASITSVGLFWAALNYRATKNPFLSGAEALAKQNAFRVNFALGLAGFSTVMSSLLLHQHLTRQSTEQRLSHSYTNFSNHPIKGKPN